MKFGNWTLNEDSIDFDNGKVDYSVWPLTVLGERIEVGDNEWALNWPIHMAEKTWMTPKDVSDFLEAFDTAIARQNINVPDNIRASTLSCVAFEVARKK